MEELKRYLNFKYGRQYGYMYCTFESLIEEDKDNLSLDVYVANDFIEEIDLGFLFDEITKVLLTLTDREQEVIRCRFFDDMTLDACGIKFGVTKERIRQIEAKALRKLSHPSRSDKLYLIWKHLSPKYVRKLKVITEASKLLETESVKLEIVEKITDVKRSKNNARPLIKKICKKPKQVKEQDLPTYNRFITYHKKTITEKRLDLLRMYPYCLPFIQEYEMEEVEDNFGGLVFSSKKTKPSWIYADTGKKHFHMKWYLEMDLSKYGYVPPLHEETYFRWLREAQAEQGIIC